MGAFQNTFDSRELVFLQGSDDVDVHQRSQSCLHARQNQLTYLLQYLVFDFDSIVRFFGVVDASKTLKEAGK
jgi:hypothetical protein